MSVSQVHHHTAEYYKRQAQKKHNRGLLVATTPLNLLRMEVTSVINHIVRTAPRFLQLLIVHQYYDTLNMIRIK